MKIKTEVTTLTALLLLALILSGCSSTKDTDIVRVMKIAPENTYSIIYLNLDTVKKDPDCELMYNDMLDSFQDEVSSMHVSDITGYGLINVEQGGLTFKIGNYDIKDIRNNLKEQGATEDEYHGIEIWTSDMYGITRAYAFINNMVIFGDKETVEASIRAHKKDEPSLYDNEDVKGILDKLPNGIFHLIINSKASRYTSVPGSAIGRISLCNLTEGDEFLDIRGLFKFENEADAEAYLGDIKEYAKGFLFGTPLDVEVELNGQYIEITGTSDIDDF